MPIRPRSRLLTGSRPLLVAAAMVPVLALAAGCGGGGGGGGKSSANGGGDTKDAATGLTRSLLTSKDLPGVTVVPATSTDQLLGGPQQVTPAACRPIADQWNAHPVRPRQSYAGAMVTDTAAKARASKTISLELIASYRPGEAKAVLDELTTAVRGCRNYHVTRGTATTTISVQPAPDGGTRLGDQQIAYTVADTSGGAKGIVLVTVVRTGDTIAAYETLRQDHQPATLRPAIPLAQAAKLRTASGGH